MSISLIESKRRSQKSVHGTFVSIAIHAGVISLAVYATASAGEVIVKSPVDTVNVIYVAPPKEPHGPSEPTPSSWRPARTNGTAIPHEPLPFPTTIPTKLPPITTSTPAIDDGRLFGITEKGHGVTTGNNDVGDGQPLFASQVEKPALARDGNPIPKYPSLLESSRVEGIVLVEFVVDTLGRADMGTFRVLASSNELFARSLEAALPKWRFYPAEAGGRKVKQMVQLPLSFVAPHR